jgi:hypothetical protein
MAGKEEALSNVHTVLSEVWQVYFMRCGRFVKIGYSAEPARRLAIVQCYNPLPVVLVATIPCSHKNVAMALERDLHQRFGEYRTRGEWFRWSYAIRRFVRGESGGS